MTTIFQAYIDHAYHFCTYKHTHTIILKKSQKENYIISKVWQPIALLNTMGKILESILAAKISYFTKEYQLIPSTQMGDHLEKFTKTVLKLLIEQINTV